MKVGTDGVLLGAWFSLQPLLVDEMKHGHPETHTHHILDIGTGTGLIALMAAQRAHTYNILYNVFKRKICIAKQSIIWLALVVVGLR